MLSDRYKFAQKQRPVRRNGTCPCDAASKGHFFPGTAIFALIPMAPGGTMSFDGFDHSRSANAMVFNSIPALPPIQHPESSIPNPEKPEGRLFTCSHQRREESLPDLHGRHGESRGGQSIYRLPERCSVEEIDRRDEAGGKNKGSGSVIPCETVDGDLVHEVLMIPDLLGPVGGMPFFL